MKKSGFLLCAVVLWLVPEIGGTMCLTPAPGRWKDVFLHHEVCVSCYNNLTQVGHNDRLISDNPKIAAGLFGDLPEKILGRYISKNDNRDGKASAFDWLGVVKSGLLKPDEYDAQVTGLAVFVARAGEPEQEVRRGLGCGVLSVLGVFVVLTFLLMRAYWKDVH